MARNPYEFPQDHSDGRYLVLTLRELKSIVDSTAGHPRPTPKYLRECGTLVVRKDMDDCSLEVYKSGFAVYQTACHYTVLRMEETGDSQYASVVNGQGNRVNTENMDWSVGVMLCGESRIDDEIGSKDANRLVSTTTIGITRDDDWYGEYEFDAGVDLEQSLLNCELVATMLSRLSDQQAKVVYLCLINGKTIKQAANELGISFQAVAKSKAAALKKIKKFFG